MPEAPRESGTSGANARVAQQQSTGAQKAPEVGRAARPSRSGDRLDSPRAAGVADHAPQAQLDERRE